MTMTFKCDVKLPGLEKLRAAAVKLAGRAVSVGVNKKDDARTPTGWESRGIEPTVASNATVAAMMEFGNDQGPVPVYARPFLHDGINNNFVPSYKQRVPRLKRKIVKTGEMENFAADVAGIAYDGVMESFDGGSYMGNPPDWVEEKGNSQPLHGKSGQLRAAIDAVVTGQETPF